MMTDEARRAEEQLIREVRDAIVSGLADAELMRTKPARDAAIKAIHDAERIDPEKTRRTVIDSSINTPTTADVSLESMARLAREANKRYAKLDRKVWRFDGTFEELIAHFKAAGIAIGPSYEGSHADGSPIKWMMSNPSALEVWRIGGSFYIGTPEGLKKLEKGPERKA